MFISSKVSVALSWMILLTPKPVIAGDVQDLREHFSLDLDYYYTTRVVEFKKLSLKNLLLLMLDSQHLLISFIVLYCFILNYIPKFQ